MICSTINSDRSVVLTCGLQGDDSDYSFDLNYSFQIMVFARIWTFLVYRALTCSLVPLSRILFKKRETTKSKTITVNQTGYTFQKSQLQNRKNQPDKKKKTIFEKKRKKKKAVG